MKNRKRLVSILAGIMAAIMLLSLIASIVPVARAASSSEIRKQINELKEQKKEIEDQIKEVKDQYKQNENELLDIVDRKNAIDQEIGLLHAQIRNINEQLTAFNILIADKQDELDVAEARFEALSRENKDRIRTMEEEGAVTYWEVLFKANSFSCKYGYPRSHLARRLGVLSWLSLSLTTSTSYSVRRRRCHSSVTDFPA